MRKITFFGSAILVGILLQGILWFCLDSAHSQGQEEEPVPVPDIVDSVNVKRSEVITYNVISVVEKKATLNSTYNRVDEILHIFKNGLLQPTVMRRQADTLIVSAKEKP